jgi:hypothetical protein
MYFFIRHKLHKSWFISYFLYMYMQAFIFHSSIFASFDKLLINTGNVNMNEM